MDDTNANPTVEAITETADATTEGSVASISEDAQAKTDEVVPLASFLKIKEEVKELRQTLKDARPQTKAEERASIKDLTTRYKDVDPDFIKGIVEAATAEAEAKFAPIFQSQESEKQQEKFEKAFDAIYTKALSENPDAKNVDKDVIKALALTPQYNNTPITELIKKLYSGEDVGRATTENDMRNAPEIPDESVDVTTLTAEQRARVMADPKSRASYFAKLDALGR